MKVLEDHQRGLGQLVDVHQRRDGVGSAFDRLAAMRARERAQAARGAPLDQVLAVGARDLAQQALDALLLEGDEINERVARPNERVDFAQEGRLIGHRR